MKKKFTVIAILAILSFVVGCDKLGIKKYTNDNKTDKDKTVTAAPLTQANTYNPDMDALQKQIDSLQSDNAQLNLLVTQKEAMIKNLQGQVASAEAELQTMQEKAAVAKKTEIILGIIAVVFIIITILLLWYIFKSKKSKYEDKLPPVNIKNKKDKTEKENKKDNDIIEKNDKNSEETIKKEEKTENKKTSDKKDEKKK